MTPQEMVEKTYKFVGLSGSPKTNAARERLKVALHNEEVDDYTVSEFVFHYLAPRGSKVMSVYSPKNKTNHYFIQWPDGKVVDFTAGSFDKMPDYGKAKITKFKPPTPSRKTRDFAAILGYDDEDL